MPEGAQANHELRRIGPVQTVDAIDANNAVLHG